MINKTDIYEKSGYLNSDFKIFHLTYAKTEEIPFHYHDFHKILIFIHGNINYNIEGRSFRLLPDDIVFVHAGDVHRPELTKHSDYERIIIYISEHYIHSFEQRCFSSNLHFSLSDFSSNVLRPSMHTNANLIHSIYRLHDAVSENEFGSELYKEAVFSEFFVLLVRAVLKNMIEFGDMISCDEKLFHIIDYINTHLTEDIHIDTLASSLYLSRSRLMHFFKEKTGASLGQYISNKRLILARHLIESGCSRTEACFQCGYKNYSTFTRAYNKQLKNLCSYDKDSSS